MFFRGTRFASVFLILIFFVTACNLPASPTTTPPPRAGRDSTQTAIPASATPLLPTPKPRDLKHQPLYWFGPLPPMSTDAGRPFIGSEDFMSLFAPDAPWSQAAGHIQVFKLYGEWVAYNATDAQLRQVVDDLRQRGLALAVEAGPSPPPADCGQGVESFAGIPESRKIADRIKAAGGTIDLIAMDEPYFFGHFYDGPNACHFSAEKIAQGVGEYIQFMRGEFPDVIIGDTEPISGPAGAPEYQAWLDIFRQVNGYDPAFLHLDVDWSRSTWPQEVKSIEDYGRGLGIPIGIIYTGNFQDQTDEAWLSIAGERVKRYELQTGGKPDQVLFQSWNDKPDHVLPESDPYTFTGFIKTYFEDKAGLGFRTQGQGANLAFNQSARASASEGIHPAEQAVDGDPGTWWSAGNGPPQWIEIDLGAPMDIQEIHLIPSQYPEGKTVHRVRGKGPGTGGVFVVLYTFEGPTQDSQVLSYKPPEPWKGIQVIRIETTASPSWVAWREIELIDAGE